MNGRESRVALEEKGNDGSKGAVALSLPLNQQLQSIPIPISFPTGEIFDGKGLNRDDGDYERHGHRIDEFQSGGSRTISRTSSLAGGWKLFPGVKVSR
ncbi:unnamed protein product [Linum trigynum]|uniref:Uncharacterized protein n=1 Tax=Linum trigynum TaxID=586398 RepID=A0AAV2E8D2_9ROSI